MDDVNMTTESSLWQEENLTSASNVTGVPTVSSSSSSSSSYSLFKPVSFVLTSSFLFLSSLLSLLLSFSFFFPHSVRAVSSSSNGRIDIFLLVVSILLFIFAAVSALSNLAVILAFFFERKLRSNFTTLIVNQAVADFMVSIVPMPLLTVTILVGYWPFGRVMCGIWCVVDYSATLASVYALVAICIDRLWATKWCHHYRKYNTKKKIVIMCASVW